MTAFVSREAFGRLPVEIANFGAAEHPAIRRWRPTGHRVHRPVKGRKPATCTAYEACNRRGGWNQEQKANHEKDKPKGYWGQYAQNAKKAEGTPNYPAQYTYHVISPFAVIPADALRTAISFIYVFDQYNMA